jgi:hypothetical protein
VTAGFEYKDGCGIWSMSDSCTLPGGKGLGVPFVIVEDSGPVLGRSTLTQKTESTFHSIVE